MRVRERAHVFAVAENVTDFDPVFCISGFALFRVPRVVCTTGKTNFMEHNGKTNGNVYIRTHKWKGESNTRAL